MIHVHVVTKVEIGHMVLEKKKLEVVIVILMYLHVAIRKIVNPFHPRIFCAYFGRLCPSKFREDYTITDKF